MKYIPIAVTHLFLTIGMVGVVVDVTFHGWSWWLFGLALLFWVLMAQSISVGWHRYMTHRSFRLAKGWCWLEIVLLIPAGWAWMNRVLWWAAVHQQHHVHQDKQPTDASFASMRASDPHSPIGSWLHFFRVQGGWWVPVVQPDVAGFVKHREPSPFARFLNHRLVALLLGPVFALVASFSLGCVLVDRSQPLVVAGLRGLVWYLAAACMTWHLTQSINSLGHSTWFGSRTCPTNDHSVNPPGFSGVGSFLLVPIGLLWVLATFGEGWHHYHHFELKSARFSRYWWQVDPGWYEIRVLEIFRMVQNVTRPQKQFM